MNLSELDSTDYADIPLYSIGDSTNFSLPISIVRYTNQEYLSPLHRHDVIQINYVMEGTLIHKIQHSEYTLIKGDIFVIPPFIPHQLIQWNEEAFEVIELEFEPNSILGNTMNPVSSLNENSSIFDFSYIEPFLVSECDVRPRLNLTGKMQLHVEALFTDMLKEFETRSDSFLLSMKADLLKLLVLVGRAFHEHLDTSHELSLFNNHRDAMLKAIQYINEHYSEPLTIEEISRYALLSQSYFSYLFKTLTSRTFIEYLTDLRIKHAMQLLSTTHLRVIDICLDCGFHNVNHFNRTFKASVGVSPTQYRKLNRKV